MRARPNYYCTHSSCCDTHFQILGASTTHLFLMQSSATRTCTRTRIHTKPPLTFSSMALSSNKPASFVHCRLHQHQPLRTHTHTRTLNGPLAPHTPSAHTNSPHLLFKGPKLEQACFLHPLVRNDSTPNACCHQQRGCSGKKERPEKGGQDVFARGLWRLQEVYASE
jgi:hypothetical protein